MPVNNIALAYINGVYDGILLYPYALFVLISSIMGLILIGVLNARK